MNNSAKKLNKFLISGTLLTILMVACAGRESQPAATFTPTEPTRLATSTPGTSYPEPGGINPYPPAGQIVSPIPYPVPPQPGPGYEQPYPAPWQPQASDQSLQRGEVFIDEMDILVMESFPPQYTLTLQGSLPTPCHQLRVQVALPDDQNTIQVEAYSVVDPNAICAQVLSPFQASVPLQGLPSGKYTVVVNSKEAGTIEVP